MSRSRAGGLGAVALLAVLGMIGGAFAATHDDGTALPPPATAPATALPTGAATVGPADAASTPPAAAPGSALAAARLLTVKGRAPKTGYARDQFGAAWKDTDRNGCDQRNDVLNRDLTERTHKAGTRDCVVLTGTLADPYSGATIAFERGETTSSAVQIDHVVALSDAWQKGAQQWAVATREAFATDPLNLLAVDGPLNSQKSDGDTATWLPPDTAFWCEYVARQVAVKAGYALWVTAAEQDAMIRVLSSCPAEPLPDGATASTAVAGAAPAAGPDTGAGVVPAAGFESCAAARAAGAAPVHLGQPGYAAHLDGDGDGVGCE